MTILLDSFVVGNNIVGVENWSSTGMRHIKKGLHNQKSTLLLHPPNLFDTARVYEIGSLEVRNFYHYKFSFFPQLTLQL